MEEYNYAVQLYKDLKEFKQKMTIDKDYIGCLQYLNIEELKNKNIDIEKFLRCCKVLDLKADYPQKLKECKKSEYNGKNLIALILN